MGGEPGGCDLFHSGLTLASGMNVVGRLVVVVDLERLATCIAATCGMYSQPFWS